MTSIARSSGSQVWWLLVTAFLGAIIIQTGHLGSVDAGRRLQVAHSFWTSAPSVAANDEASFGVPGRDGEKRAWYGIGQSLVMLPADVVATGIVSSSERLRRTDETQDGAVRRAIVAYSISPLICVLVVFVCYCLLRVLGFAESEALGGTAALLFTTTFLYYTQVFQENNLLLLLTVSGSYFHLRWAHEQKRWALAAGCLLIGFALLVRLTTALDYFAVVFLVLAILHTKAADRGNFRRTAFTYVAVCAATFLVFLTLDRWYQYERFGSMTDTYISRFGDYWKLTHPGTQSSFPFSTPFREGFLGPLITLNKSIFLYDPLLILTAWLVLRFRNKLNYEVKVFLCVQLCLLIAYICFYARYYDWSGDNTWGDRFVSTPVQLICLTGGALAIRFYPAFERKWQRIVVWLIALTATAFQVSSLLLSANLEIIQCEVNPDRMSFIIGLRFLNLFAKAIGRFDSWGLSDGVPLRETAINLMPFGPAQFLPGPVSRVLLILWLAALASFAYAGFRCYRRVWRIIPVAPTEQERVPRPPE